METIQESDVIPIEKVQLHRRWAFWENYDTKAKKEKLDWSQLTKKIFSFDTIIDFWQFWNHYPGSDPVNLFFNGERFIYFFKEEFRVNAMSFFQEGIRPEWEDEQNKGGKILSMDYSVDIDGFKAFIEVATKAWDKMMLGLLGENLFGAEYINGIRFVDKTRNDGKKGAFRFEVWIRKGIEEDKLEEMKVKYGSDFGCEGINVRSIGE